MKKLTLIFCTVIFSCAESDVKLKVVSASDLFDSETEWKTKGQRPANHPKVRLEQYAKLWEMNPEWISQVENTKIPKSKKKLHFILLHLLEISFGTL